MTIPNTFKSELDRKLAGAAGELLRQLEAALPAECGCVILMYNKHGADLTLCAATMNDHPGDVQRVLCEALAKLTSETPSRTPPYEPPTDTETQYFVSPDIGPSKFGPHTDVLISSAAVINVGGPHDHVRVWSRGGLAGELVVTAGDGARVAAALGLVASPLSDTPVYFKP